MVLAIFVLVPLTAMGMSLLTVSHAASTMVADIAGADDAYGTADDCTGGDGGFMQAVYDESAGGTGLSRYCESKIVAAIPMTRYAVREFRQQ